MNISPYIIPGLKFFDGLPELSDKLNFIETTVTNYFGETVEGMKVKSRIRRKVLCRHICYYLMRGHTDLSFKEIGGRFSGQDHTTVMHGIKSLKNQMFTDEKIKVHVNLLEAKIDERN